MMTGCSIPRCSIQRRKSSWQRGRVGIQAGTSIRFFSSSALLDGFPPDPRAETALLLLFRVRFSAVTP
jgi:hypothetical protein